MEKSIEDRLVVAGWRRDNWQRLGFELSDAVDPKCKLQTALQILR